MVGSSEYLLRLSCDQSSRGGGSFSIVSREDDEGRKRTELTSVGCLHKVSRDTLGAQLTGSIYYGK